MEVKKWQEAKRWLTRPKVSPKERADVLQWIDYNNGKFGTEEQAKEYKKKYARAPNKYDESEDPRYVPPEEMIDIKKELQVSPMVKKPKKEIIKKVVEKPKPTYLNGNVIDITPLLDDEWWSIFGEDPPKEESRLLLVPKSKAEGIRSILNLHKKFVG